MKSQQVFQIGAFSVAVVVSALCWLKITGAVVIPWLVIVMPLIVIGGFELLYASVIVVVSMLIMGRIIVDRADAKARKGKTIRKGRRK